MNRIEHLIISSSIDYSTDYISLELKKRNQKYLRINWDQLDNSVLSYSLDDELLKIITSDDEFSVQRNNLKSVYFRAPVFIRSNKHYSLEKQLYRSQWSSFIRNLILFENAKWINHPVSTYKAENKLFQLEKARQCGLLTPTTFVANGSLFDVILEKKYVVKSLDTALFFDDGNEFFTYSIVMTGAELKKASLTEAPVIIQEYLDNKTDIRVTYIDGKCFAVLIKKNGSGIYGDWRVTRKDELSYSPFVLPNDIQDLLVTFMKNIGLLFGGIDLIYSEGKFYFIEVNPTGEWGWLAKTVSLPIPSVIVDCMVS